MGSAHRRWQLTDAFGQRWCIQTGARPSGIPSGPGAIEGLLSAAFSSWGPSSAPCRSALLSIYEAIEGPFALDELRRDVSRHEGAEGERHARELLRSALTWAQSSGRLHITRETPPPVPEPHEAPIPPRPTPKEEPRVDPLLSWFEVRVVDAFGKAIAGVELELSKGASKQITSAAGIARWSDVHADTSFANVRVAGLANLRARLLPDWGRGVEKRQHDLDGTRPSLLADEISLPVRSEERTTLILENPAQRVRLVGMHFDKNKCFLLPSAMPGIRKVRMLYGPSKTKRYLVVGHTDSTGETRYNEQLSLERARAIVAFLRDDADEWLAWFSAKDDEKRWGRREVSAMLSALPEAAPPFVKVGHTASVDAIRSFQQWSNETRGTSLAVDGDAGPLTRRALVEAYMALDHTSLPAGATITAHGCGPHHPPRDTDAYSEEARRVDVFAFDGALLPEPPGPISKAGSTEYPLWVQNVTETYDVRGEDHALLRIWLMDENRQRMPNAPYQLDIGSMVRQGFANAEGLVEEHGLERAGKATLSFGQLAPDDPRRGLLDYRYRRDVHTFLTGEPGPDEHALHNLAYTTDSIEHRRIAFEADYEAPSTMIEVVHRKGTNAPDATERKKA